MDELEEQLARERRRRALKKLGIFLVIMLILGIISSYILVILSVILMLAGVSSMYEVGIVVDALWGETITKKNSIHEKANFDRSFYEGLLLIGAGFGILMITFYAMSMGWYGLIKF